MIVGNRQVHPHLFPPKWLYCTAQRYILVQFNTPRLALARQSIVISCPHGPCLSSNTNFTGTSNTNFTGNYGGGFMNANATTFGSGTANTFGSTSVVRAPTAGAAATVYMFHANEPGAQGAFDAAQTLKQYSW
jgi:hypothetical protein